MQENKLTISFIYYRFLIKQVFRYISRKGDYWLLFFCNKQMISFVEYNESRSKYV
jgi:hypothetical protein